MVTSSVGQSSHGPVSVTILADLLNYLEMEGCGQVGVDLFETTLREDPDTQLILVEIDAGFATEIPLNQFHDGWMRDTIGLQLMARGAPDDSRMPRNFGQHAYNKLIRVMYADLGDTRVQSIVPISPVRAIGRDDDHRYMFTAEFRMDITRRDI